MAAAKKKQLVVILPDLNPKKHSACFKLGDGVKAGQDDATDAVYVKNWAVEALGNPDAIKVTIEPA